MPALRQFGPHVVSGNSAQHRWVATFRALPAQGYSRRQLPGRVGDRWLQQQQTNRRRAEGRLAQVAAAQQAGQAAQAQEQESPLQNFLGWLIANGVEGIGTADSKIGLYQGEGSERGVVCLRPIAAGEAVMRIPMRLAITDQPDDDSDDDDGSGGGEAAGTGSGGGGGWAGGLQQEEQPWSVRLAGRLLEMLEEERAAEYRADAEEEAEIRAAVAAHAAAEEQAAAEEEGQEEICVVAGSEQLAGKLLGMVRQGGGSAWQPYLQVLPECVPSPLTTFGWEDVQAIEYQPMRRQLDHATWLAASASQQQAGGSGSRFTREQWEWAMSVVHSRTFGTPGASGGVGVRMLVPLVDMLNHAGDYVITPPGASSPSARAFDNVRWDLQASRGPDSDEDWHMVVTATKDIAPGEELLLSYGERSNDDFFLHYGFVPPRNPHDDVALFPDLESGVDWWLDAYLPAGALPPAHLQVAINQAYAAAEQQDGSAAVAESVLRAVPEGEAEAIRAELNKMKLSAGGMLDGRLLAAYRCLYEAAAAAGVSAQQLGGGASWQEHLQQAVGRRCRELLLGMPAPLLEDLAELAAWEQQSGEQQHCWAATQQHYAAAVAAYEARHGSLQAAAAAAAAAESGLVAAVPAEPAVQAAGGLAAGGPAGAYASGGSSAGPVLLDAGAGADAALAQLLLQQAAQQQQQQQQEAEAAADAGRNEEGSSSRSSGRSILPLIYRTYKKMILWDALLVASQ